MPNTIGSGSTPAQAATSGSTPAEKTQLPPPELGYSKSSEAPSKMNKTFTKITDSFKGMIQKLSKIYIYIPAPTVCAAASLGIGIGVGTAMVVTAGIAVLPAIVFVGMVASVAAVLGHYFGILFII